MEDIKILIVDDDYRNIFALKSYLEIHDMEVVVANTGIEAIEVMERNPPNIILMDIMMPEMDGYEAIKILKSKSATKSIPIIAVTAKAMKGDKEKCLEAGANYYLSKPIKLAELISKIKSLINTSG